MSSLFEVCACEEELKALKGMTVVNVVDYVADNGNAGVHIEFTGPGGQKLELSIADGADLHRSGRLQPLYCAQDLRKYEGYTIAKVYSNDADLECRVYLKNANGDSVVLLPDKALDGETLFVEE